MWCFYQFLLAIAFFHTSEFYLAYVFNRSELGWDSWLLSKQYCFAMTFAVCEHFLELFLFPSVKSHEALRFISGVGLGGVIIGEFLRKGGMITAGRSFTHCIRTSRKPDHKLVTSGIYRYIRHPGYLGWLIWSVSTQVLLVNPLSTLIFAYVSWRFFAERIPYEEHLLRQLFGDKYALYAASTPTWIPGIG